MEEVYLLTRHFSITYTEALNMAVAERKWFIEKLSQEFKERR